MSVVTLPAFLSSSLPAPLSALLPRSHWADRGALYRKVNRL
ncbi:MAG: hypothetical protein SO065_09140 [Lawsonibacter sp.]|nr:hypothetical protein [Flintibacter sp.]MDY5038695.1 hypothetical protein [Lawsonibacter sp.]